MAVSIRLARLGAKKKPQYLIVAIHSTQKRDGKYLEKLGHYYPHAKKAADQIKVDLPAVQAWIKKGAMVSQTTQELLKSAQKSL